MQAGIEIKVKFKLRAVNLLIGVDKIKLEFKVPSSDN